MFPYILYIYSSLYAIILNETDLDYDVLSIYLISLPRRCWIRSKAIGLSYIYIFNKEYFDLV